jgi:GTPase
MSGFVDECGLNVRGGDGGAGCVSMRRESFVDKGGPDGGDGGKGGDVWLVADHNVASLLAFRDHPHRRAGDGAHGSGSKLHGKTGKDHILTVPVGTTARDLYTGEILADLTHHGDRWIGAAGGRGGRGNARFHSNKLKAPTFAEQGEAGEEQWLKLELRLMADVALVGFPNVGKSTFISRISRAKPKIADYPFTTLEPNLGVVRMDDGVELVVADIPGLIEGAAEGRGLGHQFLRHVERARVLLLLLDLAPIDGIMPDEQERVLLRELEAYRPELLDRPRLVVGSRVDMAEHLAPEVLAEERSKRLVISSMTGEGLNETVGRLATLVTMARRAEPEVESFTLHRPTGEGVAIESVGERAWRVSGRNIERTVALNDVTTFDAIAFIDDRLRKQGVYRALARAGALTGDVVHIGAFSFDYESDS